MYSYPPIADFNRPMISSPRCLSEEERIRIADLIRAGESIRAVAAALGRAPSTMSRELRRNTPTLGRYTPHRVHQQTGQKRLRSRPGKIGSTPQLRKRVQELIKRRCSPEQISRHSETTFPDQKSMHVVPETIYRALYNWQGGALAGEFYRLLRRRHLHRKPSRKIPKRRSRFSDEVLVITDRPFAQEDRSIAGEWEGDLIMGRHNRAAIATLVEWQTRLVILLPVDANDKAASV